MTDDDEVELMLPSGHRMRLPKSALMHQTGLDREHVLAAIDTIVSLNLAGPNESGAARRCVAPN